jgi:hypothetical protein
MQENVIGFDVDPIFAMEKGLKMLTPISFVL